MRGMKSLVAPTKRQNFADGGVVGAIKGMFGIKPEDPERARRLAEYQANAAREKEAAKAAPAPAPAISDYAAGSALKRREAAAGLKDGGPVRGPGTGTSDDVPDNVPEGTYIMPADSTQAIGEKTLGGLGMRGIDVNLSNGEFKLPPKQVHAIGVQTLNQLKDATHTPSPTEAAKGMKPELFFEGGGVASEEERQKRLQNQTQAYVAGAQAAAAAAPAPGASASQSLAQRVSQIPTGGQTAPAADGSQNSWANTETGRNLSNIASALPGSLGGAIPAVAKTGGAISGGIDAATRLLNAGAGAAAISAIPGAASAQGATPSTIASPPTSQTNPAAAPASTSLANAGRGVVNPPTVNPSAPAPSNAPAAAPEVMPGVYRHGRGQYSDNASGMGMPAGFTGQPNAQNMAAADALAGRSQQESMNRVAARGMGALVSGEVQAPQVLHSGNSWQARNDLRNAEVSASSITNNPNWGGMGRSSPAMQNYAAALKADNDARAAQPGMDQAAMRENAAITREGMQQAGATTRTGMTEQGANAREAGRNALTAEELGLKREAAGFQTRAAQRLESAYDNYSKAKTDEDRQAIAKQFPDLFGQAKDAAHRMEVVRGKTDPMTGQSSGDYVVVQDPKTGEVRQIQMGAASAAPTQGALPKVATPQDLAALKSGTRFVDSNGVERIKK